MALLCLAGCGESLERMYSSRLPFDGPIDWWHGLQGGTIAAERPPPPGAGQPYPSIADVPAKPTPTDAPTRAALSARLRAQRTDIAQAAAQDPIPPFKPPSIPGPLPGGAAPAAAGAPAVPAAPPPMASLDAATAPAAAPAAGPGAGPAAGSTAVPPPKRAGAPASSAAPDPAALVPTGAAAVAPGPVPALPAAAPPLANLPGVPASAADPGSVPRPRPTAVVAFLPGSAVLRPESGAALRELAARRSGGTVAVLGGGDAVGAAPDTQLAALPLAWRRARVMADALAAAGVPASAMRVDAAALGRGGVARLVN